MNTATVISTPKWRRCQRGVSGSDFDDWSGRGKCDKRYEYGAKAWEASGADAVALTAGEPDAGPVMKSRALNAD